MDSDTTGNDLDGTLGGNKKDRADNWGSRETEALIGVWKSHYVALESITHKRKIYKLVSDRLKDLGHDRNIPSVQAKINKLKTLYRKNKPDPVTGNRKPKWRFWDAVHEVVVQPLLKRGIRDRIGPGGITRETGPASPSQEGTDHTEENADKNNADATSPTENPKEKAKRAKKGPGPQARKKITIKHEEVLKKLLREEDESQVLIQKLNTSYQETVTNIMDMQKKCNDTLVSLMTVLEGYINANTPPVAAPPTPTSQPSLQSAHHPPTSRQSSSLMSNAMQQYGPMSNQHSQQFSRPNQNNNSMPQHFQGRPQSHFPQPMSACRPPSMLYQQQQHTPPPSMMAPPPSVAPPMQTAIQAIAAAPTPPVCFPSWNPLNMRSETLMALLLPNLRLGLNALQAQDAVKEDEDEEMDDIEDEESE